MKFLKKKILIPIYFLASCLFFSTCEKDFSVISTTSEIFPVVYGLLDVNESVHYVKIYKSVIAEGIELYDMAKDIHKYSYIDSIEVYLEEYDDQGNMLRRIKFDTTTSIPKDPGLFGYPVQILYKVNAVLNIDYQYKLTVYNPYTKNVIETKNPVLLTTPPFITVPRDTEKNYWISEGYRVYAFYTGKNSSRYSYRIALYYTEELFDHTTRQSKVNWTFGDVWGNPLETGVVKYYILNSGTYFFMHLASHIKDSPNVYRRYVDSVNLEVHASGKDYDLYALSGTPPTGVVRENLYYSNLKAYNSETKEEKYVMGVFSSRTKAVRHYPNLELNGPRDSLYRGRFTGHLRFTDKNE